MQNLSPKRQSLQNALHIGHDGAIALSPRADSGVIGEAIAAQWFLGQGWNVLHHRWHCRWGELDLIAEIPTLATLVFVEVKVRTRGNWDADGLLAVTPDKQAKLWQAAELFLSDSPHLASCPCRFDVVLVQSSPSRASTAQPTSQAAAHRASVSASMITLPPIHPGCWVRVGDRRFCLHRHIEHAFDG